MSKKQRIGFIGLGKMGSSMSANLLKAGYQMIVFDIVKENTRACAEAGARVAESISKLSDSSDVIISMIPNDPILEEVAVEVMGGAQSGTIYIDMSTVSPLASSKVAKESETRSIQYLRAPVSGSTALAEAGTLTIFASGPKNAYEEAEPILLSMGNKAFYVGSSEEARYMKLVINIMVGLTAAMAAEALAFGEKGGIDWNKMLDIVANSVVASPLIGYKLDILKEKNFTAAFTASQMSKDFNIALDAGAAMDMPLPMVSLVHQFLSAMMAKGKGELDFFGLLTVWEEMGGII
jgi:3-hydroxyisobutyrate dehydrogenase-like beta-hydroxyacid dehydrogenase